MKLEELKIPGCYLLTPDVFHDNRGDFVKTYHQEVFDELGITARFKEEYYSISHKGVVRGLHFQMPPHEHEKIVYCVNGSVFDVFVDLRKSSATYCQHNVVMLNSSNRSMLFLPKGIAHGFCALEENTIMMYKTSTVYAQQSDAGIHWNSADISWPDICDSSLMSERDKQFVSLSDFDSPFK